MLAGNIFSDLDEQRIFKLHKSSVQRLSFYLFLFALSNFSNEIKLLIYLRTKVRLAKFFLYDFLLIIKCS